MYQQQPHQQASCYQEKKCEKQPHQHEKRPQPRHMRFNMQNNYDTFYAEGRPRPQKLKCVFCKEEKPIKEFSEMQIAKATYNLYAPSMVKDHRLKYISCKKCTDTQQETLTCSKCAKKKPLDQFARVQRRNYDRARCLKCMKKRNEEDVNDSEPELSSEDGPLNEWDDYL